MRSSNLQDTTQPACTPSCWMYEAIHSFSLAMCCARTSLSLDDHSYSSHLMSFQVLCHMTGHRIMSCKCKASTKVRNLPLKLPTKQRHLRSKSLGYANILLAFPWKVFILVPLLRMTKFVWRRLSGKSTAGYGLKQWSMLLQTISDSLFQNCNSSGSPGALCWLEMSMESCTGRAEHWYCRAVLQLLLLNFNQKMLLIGLEFMLSLACIISGNA